MAQRAEKITRKTVREALRFGGVGIHSGVPCTMLVEPKKSGGITLEMAGSNWKPLPATAAYAIADECDRRTVLRGPDGEIFQQVEHILAALAAFGVTDARLVQGGPEPPFLDGGSAKFCQAIESAGVTDLGVPLDPLIIDRPFSLTDGDAELVATPHDGLRLSCFVEFPDTIVGSMGTSLEITARSFTDEAAPARTFALERDIEGLRKAGLAKGGNLDNAVIFNNKEYLNKRLHFKDEVARHKLIDLLGDLSLIGRPLRGHFWAWRAGHKSHVRFAQALIKEYMTT